MKTVYLSLMCSALLFGCGEGAVVEADGETSADIIGGKADAGDPAVVALFAHPANQTSGSLCTATFISQRTLLTAAHCVDPAVVGANNVFDVIFGSNINAKGATSVRAASTKFDPAFDINQLQNGHDVAVVQLAKPVNVTPIAFNTNRNLNTKLPVTLVGFGVNSHDNTGAGVKRTVQTNIVGLNNLLVQIGSSNQQTCHGDSGGPAMQVINGKQTIIGVTSFGQDFSASQVCFNGGVDTRIDAVASFVTANLAK
jgi:secreted trypsin-like serine protease